MDGKARVLATSALPVLAFIVLLYTALATPARQPTPNEAVVFYASGKTRQACDVYRPQSKQQAPLVVIVHGGAGISGDKADWWPANLADRLAQEGFLALSINYRLAPRHRWPAAVNDVRAAIDSFRARSGELRCDESRVFVIGMSAGALFAEMAAAREPHSIAGVISISGVHDLTCVRRPWVDVLLGDADRRAASPVRAVRAEFPPTLLIHGEQDCLVPVEQSLAMRHALTSQGHEARLVRMPGANHFLPPAKYFSQCYPYIVRWLREHSGCTPTNRPLTVAWLHPE